VLAAVDFSDGALGAVREARALADRLGIPLQVLHVAAPGARWLTDAHAIEWLLVASLAPSAIVVRRGLPWVEIVRHAREISAVAIVLGTHGESGVQRVTIGSTASRVATSASCPVVFAPGAVDAHNLLEEYT
jgi:nucleotide-binding universal stress UspA family protein